jgi:hypothetical protein
MSRDELRALAGKGAGSEAPPVRFPSRIGYIALACTTIGVGLLIHWSVISLDPTARDIAGDAAWAMMMTWWVSALAPRARLSVRCLVSLGICALVETSQLIHSPALDAARETQLGQLILGSGFDARDFVAYAAGVGLAAVAARFLEANR